MIRRAADGPLPEAQWSVLQAHLEACAACREYSAQLDSLEHLLRRGLRDRWNRVDGPRDRRLGLTVLGSRERRARRRLLLRQGVAGLLAAAVMLALIWINRDRLLAPPPAAPGDAAEPAGPTATAAPTIAPSPTPLNNFQGVVAFTVEDAGKTRVDLLNAGAGRSGAPDQSILTPDGFKNLAPAWSPDGAWLAFLSDRDGATQLYVISVAGTRLTRLTSGDDIAWQGPLSWSYDGQWIALTGRRRSFGPQGDQANRSWIYTVPVTPNRVDAPGPRAVAGTAGAQGWARFSPTQPLLAVQRADGGIDIYHTALGWSGEVTAASRVAQKLHTGLMGAFTWALDGLRLVYLADGPYVWSGTSYSAGLERPLAGASTQILASGVIGPYARPTALDAGQEIIDTRDGAGGMRSLAYMPGGPLLATLVDLHQTGCWTLHLKNMPLADRLRAVDVPGLCVLNMLDAASWAPDGRWLVVAAQPEDPQTYMPTGTAGLYAVEIASLGFQRLADAPAGGATAIAVRGMGQPLNLQIAAAVEPAAQAVPTPALDAAPPAVSGSLVYSVPSGAIRPGGPASAIFTSSPLGADRQVVLPANFDNVCPVFSPDGRQIAFLSGRSSASGELHYEIFLIDADGRLRQLTSPSEPNGYYNAGMTVPTYDCPVWSPDGTLIATVLRSDLLPRLDIIQLNGQLLRSMPIDQPSTGTTPVWSPDGKTIYLAEPSAAGDQSRLSGYARVASFVWRTPAGSATLLTLPGWDDVQAMSISPDGLRLALVVVKLPPQNGSDSGHAKAALEIFHLADLSRQTEMDLSIYGYDPQWQKVPGRLVWDAAGGGVTLAVPRGPFARYKTQILRFDGDHMVTIGHFDDALTGWARFGAWLVAGTEGGVYGILTGPARPGDEWVGVTTGPYLLDPSPVTTLDGR